MKTFKVMLFVVGLIVLGLLIYAGIAIAQGFMKI